MKITEFWARLVAAGLAPDWKNIWAEWYIDNWKISKDCTDEGLSFRINGSIHNCSSEENKYVCIQLRKDGIDLYKLEWRPYDENDDTDQEYWVLQSGMVGVSTVEYSKNGKPATKWGLGNPVLKKNYGAIAPTVEDFEVYSV